MAHVKIRGRADTIELDNTRAQKLKDRKFGFNGVEKAEPMELVDLGEWAGEYGRIVEIVMPKAEEKSTYTDQQKQKEEREHQKWLKQKPEVKAQRVGLFKLTYAMRLGEYKAEPPKELLKKVVEAQTKFFTENPTADRVSSACFEHLLPVKSGKSLNGTADLTKKMSARTEENGRLCKQCEKPLTGNIKDFCSGSCMLEHQNGEVSTS